MRALLVTLMVAFCLGSTAHAGPPLDAYGRLPNIEMLQLSPSGERLAYVVVTGDERQLFVRDLQKKILFTSPLGGVKIRNVEWAGDDHLIIEKSFTSTIFLVNEEFFETLVVNVRANKAIGVFKNRDDIFSATFGYYGAVLKDGHWLGYFRGFPLSKTRGFDATIDSGSVTQLYQVDLDSGAAKPIGLAYGHPHQWALGADGEVVAHTEYDETYGAWTLRKGGEGGRAIVTLHQPLGEIDLVGLGPTPDTVVIAKTEPEVWNLADASHAPLFPSTPTDNVSYLFDPTTRRLLGVQLSGDQIRQQFFDPTLNARLAGLRKAFSGEPLITSWSADFKRLIVFTDRDGDPGTYWLVDGASAQAYGDSYPDIPDAEVAKTTIVAYKAGDGLEIHGVLTLPPRREPKALPLVVMPHGGPQDHDSVGFNWWAQAFASRGYAVFQPNFRGSDGYGQTFRDAGFGQWGRKMQTDLSDGVDELVRQGIVDPRRACIVGASYGGYAALAGVTVEKGRYLCAVSYGGISDLNYLLNHEIPGDDSRSASGRYLLKFTGARSDNDPMMAALSPARLATRADAPILLIHGSDDSVVPIGQSRAMERNLKAAGKPVEFVVIKGEDHWLSQDATRKAMLAASVAFVEKYNPAP